MHMSETLASNRRLGLLADFPILLFIAFAIIAVCIPVHNDTWWHLRLGREIWTAMAVPKIEHLAFPIDGQPVANLEWLTQLLFFALYSAGGPFLLSVFCGGCALAAAWMSWRLIRSGPASRLVLLVILLVGVVPEWAVRPQAISLLLFICSVRLATTGNILWLPLLCVLWSNMHGAVLLAVVVAACAALESLIWSRGEVMRHGLVTLGCAVAPILTPLGTRFWPQVMTTVRVSQLIGIHEFRTSFELPQASFWAVVAAFVFMTVRRRRDFFETRENRLLWLITCVLALAAASAVRNIPFFLLVACPALSRLIASGENASVSTVPNRRTSMIPAALTAAIVVVVSSYRWRDGGKALGWQPVSVAAADAIRGCPEPMFNGFVDGGPVLWFVPERRVFVDSRVTPYPIALLMASRRADLYGEYEELFQNYRFRCAVVAARSPMASRLSKDPSMTMRYADYEWVIFAANGN